MQKVRQRCASCLQTTQADRITSSLSDAQLVASDLSDADLSGANFSRVDLSGAYLMSANGSGVNFSGANLRRACLINTNFSRANLSEAIFHETDLGEAHFFHTLFAWTDLSLAQGLETTLHHGPSSVDINSVTLPSDEFTRLHFLRGVGFTETQIEYLPSLLTPRPIEYHSLFISYAHQDEVVARQLYKDLRRHDVPCWFAPRDLCPGTPIGKTGPLTNGPSTPCCNI